MKVCPLRMILEPIDEREYPDLTNNEIYNCLKTQCAWWREVVEMPETGICAMADICNISQAILAL